MEEDTLPSYDTVQGALLALDALGGPADTHGILTAMLVSCVAIHRDAWLNSLMTQQSDEGDLVAKDARRALERLFDTTQTGLESDTFSFDLLLPMDDNDLETRIDALSSWCQGFVSGLNLIGIQVDNVQGEDLQEAMNDLINMSCLEYDHEQTGDQASESAYTELVEYARTAVMLLYQSLRSQKQGMQNTQTVH